MEKSSKDLKDAIAIILKNEAIRRLSIEQIQLLPSMLNSEIKKRIREYNKSKTFETTNPLSNP